ncbi:hypothetical protein EYF80_000749 [Liparis tanakae]|uniref:Uncharacterized protein n=1 Tax=Liparis tanakae TaxID=230148 RepID=A0A4Z2JFW7_9TELE|nr:hypothetical protein EYF80_000749 [Liparis tanakae]
MIDTPSVQTPKELHAKASTTLPSDTSDKNLAGVHDAAGQAGSVDGAQGRAELDNAVRQVILAVDSLVAGGDVAEVAGLLHAVWWGHGLEREQAVVAVHLRSCPSRDAPAEPIVSLFLDTPVPALPGQAATEPPREYTVGVPPPPPAIDNGTGLPPPCSGKLDMDGSSCKNWHSSP